MARNLGKTDALIIIDIQRDFCPGGALPVPEGNKIVPIVNKYMENFLEAHAKIFATRDWHPPNHISFKPQGGPWPPHCVQGTLGAEFHPDFKFPSAEVISKAMNPDIESYSAFDDTDLEKKLRNSSVKRVFVGGLATDYCVKRTVLDALQLGFETTLLIDATRGIDVNKGDVEKAIEEMKNKGARIATLSLFGE